MVNTTVDSPVSASLRVAIFQKGLRRIISFVKHNKTLEATFDSQNKINFGNTNLYYFHQRLNYAQTDFHKARFEQLSSKQANKVTLT